MLPHLGHTDGGTQIALFSKAGFDGGSDYRCKFGDEEVRAVLLESGPSHGNLSCTSVSALAGSVAVEVALNGQQFSSSGVRFLYHEREQVLGLSRSSGISLGSTLVLETEAVSQAGIGTSADKHKASHKTRLQEVLGYAPILEHVSGGLEFAREHADWSQWLYDAL